MPAQVGAKSRRPFSNPKKEGRFGNPVFAAVLGLVSSTLNAQLSVLKLAKAEGPLDPQP